MGYKFNSGHEAYTCHKCDTIIATGWNAIALRVSRLETGIKPVCDACKTKEAIEEVMEEQSEVLEKLD